MKENDKLLNRLLGITEYGIGPLAYKPISAIIELVECDHYFEMFGGLLIWHFLGTERYKKINTINDLGSYAVTFSDVIACPEKLALFEQRLQCVTGNRMAFRALIETVDSWDEISKAVAFFVLNRKAAEKKVPFHAKLNPQVRKLWEPYVGHIRGMVDFFYSLYLVQYENKSPEWAIQSFNREKILIMANSLRIMSNAYTTKGKWEPLSREERSKQLIDMLENGSAKIILIAQKGDFFDQNVSPHWEKYSFTDMRLSPFLVMTSWPLEKQPAALVRFM